MTSASLITVKYAGFSYVVAGDCWRRLQSTPANTSPADIAEYILCL